MNTLIQSQAKTLRVWHGLYFISLYDADQMSEAQAADKLRRMAEDIRQQYKGLLIVDLDEDSLHVCDLP